MPLVDSAFVRAGEPVSTVQIEVCTWQEHEVNRAPLQAAGFCTPDGKW